MPRSQSYEATRQACAKSCAVVAACQGFFLRTQDWDYSCVGLSDLGDPTASSTVSESFFRLRGIDSPTVAPSAQPAILFPYSLWPSDPFRLAGAGATMFEHALASQARLFEANWDPHYCLQLCAVDARCLGVFLWQHEQSVVCFGLDTLGTLVDGTDQGVTASQSFVKAVATAVPTTLLATASPTTAFPVRQHQYELAYAAGGYRMFSTSFTEHAILFKERASLFECLDMCDETPTCQGVYLWSPPGFDNTRCVGLRDLGTSAGLAANWRGFAYRKLAVNPVGGNLSLGNYSAAFQGLGSLEAGDSRRFATAFQSEYRLFPAEDVADAEQCFERCEKLVACSGVVVAETLDRLSCYALSATGTATGVPTTTHSTSYVRVGRPSNPDLSLAQGTSPASGLDSASSLDSLPMALGVAVGIVVVVIGGLLIHRAIGNWRQRHGARDVNSPNPPAFAANAEWNNFFGSFFRSSAADATADSALPALPSNE